MRFEGIDLRLLERCRGGDLDAFDKLCRVIQRDLYGFVYSLVRNHDDADEVLQECLVRVYKHLPKLQELDRFPGWLMKMAANQCHTQRTRVGAKAMLPLQEGVDVPNERVVGGAEPADSPREALENKQMMECVDAAIAGLPPRQRMSVILFELENRPIREIAEMLECSDGAVKFNLHEARKKLRGALGQYLAPRPKGAAE